MAQRAQRLIAQKGVVQAHADGSKRLLALEIRSGKFGFAVFDGPERLLDWGARRFGEEKGPLKSAVSNRVRPLLNVLRPYIVVGRYRDYHSTSAKRRFATILRVIRGETRRRSINFKILTTPQMHRHFLLDGHPTKYGIAATLADRFEALSWKLPAPRKPYQSEAPAMVVFDAAAVGVAFLAIRERNAGMRD